MLITNRDKSMTNVKLIIYLSQLHTSKLPPRWYILSATESKINILFMSRNSFMSSQKYPSSDEHDAIGVSGGYE